MDSLGSHDDEHHNPGHSHPVLPSTPKHTLTLRKQLTVGIILLQLLVIVKETIRVILKLAFKMDISDS